MSSFFCRRPDKNPLDLNHLPEECCEDRSEGRQPAALDHENWTEAKEATRDKNKCKKRNGGKKGEDEREKVYKCRFCSLKFCKSQALGGHMNRHRQEKETETLNQARELVYNSEMGTRTYFGTIPQEKIHRGSIGDSSSLHLQSIYKEESGSCILLPPLQPYLHPTSSHIFFPCPSHQNHSPPV